LQKLLCIGVASLSILFVFGTAQGEETGGEILQDLEKKEMIPKETPRPVIETPAMETPKEVKDEKKILIKEIRVQGATLIDGQTIRDALYSAIPVAAPSETGGDSGLAVNRELSLSEMNRITNAITLKYRAHGYILAYAFIPQQEIKDGLLEIKVREGKVEDIAVTENRSYSAVFIERHLERIKEAPTLTDSALERSLLILNEYPSLSVKALLKAGKEPGTTDITAEVKDSRPMSGGISYDNFGDKTTSKNKLSASFNMGNLATSGDYLMLRGVTGLDRKDAGRLNYGRLEYLLPVNYNGARLGMNYSNAVYKAGEEFASLKINGKSNVAGIYITEPVIKEIGRSLDARFGFDYKDLNDYILGEVMSKDRIRVFNLGATYGFTDNLYGRNIISLTGYQGVRGLLGGSGNNDPGTSRLHSDGAFRKFTADVTRVQGLNGNNYLMLKANGQYSRDSLFSAEQFMSGGAWGVRGFKPASMSGDSGYLLSAEVYLSPPYPETRIFNQRLGEVLKFVLFADNGGVYRNDVQPGEDKDDSLTSLGAGIRLSYVKRFSLKLDWAVPRTEGKFHTGNSETYLQTTFSF
jgi:hemolysin activation/secretion protein